MKKEPPENGTGLLHRFAETECDSPDYCPLIQKITAYTAKHSGETVYGEKLEDAVRTVFTQAFVNCVYAYMASLKDSLMSALRQLAAWLGPTQKVTVSGADMRVRDVMKEAENISGLKYIKKLQHTDTGSPAQETLVRDVIYYAHEHGEKARIPGMDVRELAQKALLNIYAENANLFQKYESRGCRTVMHVIACAMDRSAELPGSGMTLWEYEDRAEPTLALARIRPRLEGGDYSTKDAACITYYLDDWPDFDLGEQSFKEVALSFARAMMIQSANRLQHAGGSELKKHRSVLYTCMAACSGQPGGITKQEADALESIVKHYDVADAAPCDVYRPFYPPLSREDYNAKAKKARKSSDRESRKGLFSRIRNLF